MPLRSLTGIEYGAEKQARYRCACTAPDFPVSVKPSGINTGKLRFNSAAAPGNGNRESSVLFACLDFPITIISIFGAFNYQSDTSFWPLNTQKYPAPAVKAMQSAAKKSPSLRVVFFAPALPAHPTRKYQVFIKGQKEVSHLGGPARKVYQFFNF
jgi:hypothetical protein